MLVFASLVYPGTGAMTARLASFSTLPIALFARPPGAVVSGHFEDRLGRKATLVAALRRWGVHVGDRPAAHNRIGVARHLPPIRPAGWPWRRMG
ncbi:MHS family MFS transporter [Salipiger aestuarii]|uniref:MHS family MFS transporter n=1 Tax=Salipiger aestuarii TaxID=568098 RepID=UPI001238FDB6|nr:MHS family MFS transporter [Salipiger aestuarii]